MSLIGLPLLLAGFALGALVYAGIALSVARAAITVWRAVAGVAGWGRARVEVTHADRRMAQVHQIGEAERSLRRAA